MGQPLGLCCVCCCVEVLCGAKTPRRCPTPRQSRAGRSSRAGTFPAYRVRRTACPPKTVSTYTPGPACFWSFVEGAGKLVACIGIAAGGTGCLAPRRVLFGCCGDNYYDHAPRGLGFFCVCAAGSVRGAGDASSAPQCSPCAQSLVRVMPAPTHTARCKMQPCKLETHP